MKDPNNSWIVPGDFIVEFGEKEGEVTFTFVPHAGNAGWFGPHAWNFETGAIIGHEDQEFWDPIAEKLSEREDGMFLGYWEG